MCTCSVCFLCFIVHDLLLFFHIFYLWAFILFCNFLLLCLYFCLYRLIYLRFYFLLFSVACVHWLYAIYVTTLPAVTLILYCFMLCYNGCYIQLLPSWVGPRSWLADFFGCGVALWGESSKMLKWCSWPVRIKWGRIQRPRNVGRFSFILFVLKCLFLFALHVDDVNHCRVTTGVRRLLPGHVINGWCGAVNHG